MARMVRHEVALRVEQIYDRQYDLSRAKASSRDPSPMYIWGRRERPAWPDLDLIPSVDDDGMSAIEDGGLDRIIEQRQHGLSQA